MLTPSVPSSVSKSLEAVSPIHLAPCFDTYQDHSSPVNVTPTMSDPHQSVRPFLLSLYNT